MYASLQLNQFVDRSAFAISWPWLWSGLILVSLAVYNSVSPLSSSHKAFSGTILFSRPRGYNGVVSWSRDSSDFSPCTLHFWERVARQLPNYFHVRTFGPSTCWHCYLYTVADCVMLRIYVLHCQHWFVCGDWSAPIHSHKLWLLSAGLLWFNQCVISVARFEPHVLGNVGPSGEPLLIVLSQSTVLQYSELERSIQCAPFDCRQGSCSMLTVHLMNCRYSSQYHTCLYRKQWISITAGEFYQPSARSSAPNWSYSYGFYFAKLWKSWLHEFFTNT